MGNGKIISPHHSVNNFSELLTLFEPEINKTHKKRKRVRRDSVFYLGKTKVQVRKKYKPSPCPRQIPSKISRSRPSDRAIACVNILSQPYSL